MKRYVRIKINGTEADVDATTLSLSLDLAVETDEPGQVRGVYSKRAVQIPGTGVNREIFEDVQDGTTVLTNANQLLSATVEANGVPILKGKAQLTGATFARQGRQVSTYKVALYGNNADWFLQIKNKRIRDLGWSDVTLDFAAMESIASSGTWTGETNFGLVKWKDWDQGNAITHLEHSVCLYVKWILWKAFKDLGYQITGDFLDTDLFQRLVIPIPLRPYDDEYAEDVVNARATLSATQTINTTSGNEQFILEYDDDSTFPNFDAGGNFDTGTSRYTVPTDGYYKFTYNITMTNNFDPGEILGVHVKKNGTTVLVQTETLDTTAWYGETSWYDVVAGDYFEIYIVTATNDPRTVSITSASLNVEFESREISEGQTLNLDYLIPPAWTVKDVILDLQRTFGLVIDTDPGAGTVLFEPRDPYTLTERYPTPTTTDYEGYYYTTDAIDITDDVDVSKAGELTMITDLTRYYVLDYAIDDETVGSFQESEGYRLYGARYDFGANRFQAGETVVNTDFFVKTFYAYDPGVTSTASCATVYLPVIIDGDYRLSTGSAELPDDFGPHLLYLAGRRGGLDGKVDIYNTGTSATSAYDHPALILFNPLDPSGYDPNLSFANETTDNGVQVPGLMQRFHLRHLARLEGGRRFQHYVHLDAVDVSELDFRYKRQIRAGNYLLERVDGYNPLSNGTTKLRLLKDEGPTSTQAGKISRAVLPTSDAQVAGGSGGSGGTGGGGSGGSGGSGSGTTWFRQWFYGHSSATMTITANSGILPANEAQIEVFDSTNGQIISPAYYSISGSVITLSFTPTGEDYFVRFVV